MPRRREIAISAYDEVQLRRFRALCDREHRQNAQFVKVRPAFGLWLASYALGRVPKLSADSERAELEEAVDLERAEREAVLNRDLWEKKFQVQPGKFYPVDSSKVEFVDLHKFAERRGVPRRTCAEKYPPGPPKQKVPRKAHNSRKVKR